MLKPLWNAVRHRIAENLDSHHESTAPSTPRTMQPILSALDEIGYLLPGSLGQPTRLLTQERTRRDTLVWRAA